MGDAGFPFLPVLLFAALTVAALLVRPLLMASLGGRDWRKLKAQSELMRGATATVHAIRRAPAFERVTTPEGGAPLAAFYVVDATIAPGPADPAASWDPFDLEIVDADAPPDEDPELRCDLDAIDLWQKDGFVPEDEAAEAGTESVGPCRVRAHVGVVAGVRRLTFVYGTARVGRVDLRAVGERLG